MPIEKVAPYRSFQGGANPSFKFEENFDLSSVASERFTLKDVFPYTFFTVQINLLNIVTGSTKAEIRIQDSEDNDIFVDIPVQVLTVDAGDGVLKFRIVDLKTSYFSILYNRNSLSSGAMTIYITPGGHY